MMYFTVRCEAPACGFGPSAVVTRYPDDLAIRDVIYPDIEFLVWLGGELIQDLGHCCVTAALWDHLSRNGIRGVTVRKMSVTVGEDFEEPNPGVVLPEFVELVISTSARGRLEDGYVLEESSIPDADLLSGHGLPLVVSDHAKRLLEGHGPQTSEFSIARIDRVS